MKALPFFSRSLLVALAVAALVAAFACGEGEKTVRGIVLDVQARSLTEVESLTIQDREGRMWRFQAEGNLGFTPSHIREHMLQGQEMTVTYREEGDILVALKVMD